MCLVLAVLSCPPVQADRGGANVTLTVNVVSPPSVITEEARGVGTTRATMSGNLTSLGTASSANVSFGYDTEPRAEDAYANWTPPEVMNDTGEFSSRVIDLTPGMTYYFRTKAEGDVTSYGEEMSFTTTPRGRWWRLLESLISWLGL